MSHNVELEEEHWILIQAVKQEIQAFPGWGCAEVRLGRARRNRFKAEAFEGHWVLCGGEISDYQVRIEAIRATAEAALRALPEILIQHIGRRSAASEVGMEVRDG